MAKDILYKFNDSLLLYNNKYVMNKGVGASYPTRGLVSRYNFEDTLNDTYGSNNNWTTGGAQTWSYDNSGKIGKGYNTNAADAATHAGAVIYSGDSTINSLGTGTNTMSVSLWMKPISAGNANQCWMWWHGGNILALQLASGVLNRAGASGTLTGGADLRDNAYHHVVYTYNGGNYEAFYLDGNTTPVATCTTRGSGSNGALYFGGQVNYQACFNGIMDLVYFYNVALTTSEVTQLYNGGSGI